MFSSVIDKVKRQVPGRREEEEGNSARGRGREREGKGNEIGLEHYWEMNNLILICFMRQRETIDFFFFFF